MSEEIQSNMQADSVEVHTEQKLSYFGYAAYFMHMIYLIELLILLQ